MTGRRPVWRDRDGDVWEKTSSHRLRVVVFKGEAVSMSDPLPRGEVERRWGPLTAEPASDSTPKG